MLTYFYLCATDLDQAVDIINKNPKKKIREVIQVHPRGLNSMLIDPVTGDLYEYNYVSHKWNPKINSGLHYKQMNEIDPIFKHINQRPLFVTKPVQETYPLIKGVNIEAIIRLDDVNDCLSQAHRNHYLLKNLPTSFLGINPTGWLPHPVSFLNPTKRFMTIASDDNRVPQIIVKDNMASTLFPILKKYSESVKILQNYLAEMIHRIHQDKPGIKRSIFVIFV